MPIARSALEILDEVTIPVPCPASWSDMTGGDRVRTCSACEKPVFDLSAITTVEAARLLGDADRLPCVRVRRGEDGRILTADGPAGFRERIRRRLGRHAGWAAALFALVFLPGCTRMFTYGAPARMIKEPIHAPDGGHEHRGPDPAAER